MENRSFGPYQLTIFLLVLSQSTDAAPRPSRVIIQDFGAKKDSENVARKRMFQQALLGVGGPSRSLSGKGLGRKEG